MPEPEVVFLLGNRRAAPMRSWCSCRGAEGVTCLAVTREYLLRQEAWPLTGQRPWVAARVAWQWFSRSRTFDSASIDRNYGHRSWAFQARRWTGYCGRWSVARVRCGLWATLALIQSANGDRRRLSRERIGQRLALGVNTCEVPWSQVSFINHSRYIPMQFWESP
jgi:hypothetical protein